MMSELSRQIAELARSNGAGDAFDLGAVRIVEISPRDYDARGWPIVDEDALQGVDAYAARFDELLASGYAWLNLSWMGRLRGAPLVAVELPPRRAERATATAVNFSGPSNAVRDSGGDVDAWIARPPRAGGRS